ncbi:DNA adenine methylase [Enterocloster bolteae]|uniref:DNA adenine methylase n=1 Tax=Enterocloster bolteae TaxID=208479 RepID=UPI0021093E0F|nr:Dam family site-specific DNA-(adenine-N6)-methyltransferase [Enterocloster bolteae]MCQ5141380.1 Dam family site-specific DNA-(adenine-N6)-methyltransferase [Enterocloster bolteae]
MEYVKSPLNYTGGKYKLLPQLLELFPKQVNTFVDLFAGGGNVSVNVEAEKVVFNDLMWQVPEMLQEFKKIGVEESLRKIDGYISSYDLSKENKEGYLDLRDLYNKGKSDPLMLYTLICYSFNNQIRFNNKGAYNMPFGKDRSSFNPTLREKFITFVQRLQSIEIQFSSKDFRELDLDTLGENDFVYCDPPYLITVASYNENGGWGEQAERDLLAKLDTLNKAGVKFGLSNVFESKGKENIILKEWAKGYTVHYLDHTYSNCSYHKKDKQSKDIEVFITNY